jgi:hypothetical protein
VIVNSPINFAGDTGSVIVPLAVPTVDPLIWLVVVGAGAAIGLRRRHGLPRSLAAHASTGRRRAR